MFRSTALPHLCIAAVSAILLLSCSSQAPVQKADIPVVPPPVTAVVPHDRSQWVDSVLASMTVEQKIGQMMMVGVTGHYFSSTMEQYARLVRLVRERQVGGVILWRGDVYESALRLNALQTMSAVPLLVSADLERGVPMRVRRGTPFPDAMAIGATRNTQYAFDVGRAIAREARAIGVHQNYAPVADVNTNPLNPVINTRAFGGDPELVEGMVDAFTRGTQSAGVLATAKHFPGHGDTGTDSHLDLPAVPHTRSRLDSIELLPFRAAVCAGVRSVMIGHLSVPALDPSRSVPSSLSPAIVTGLLQRELGFGGLIVTDAMDMRGVTRDYSPGMSSVLAVKAGVDIVLMPPDEESAFAAMTAAARTGEITQERLDRSVRKILKAKWDLGLDTLCTSDPEEISRVVGSRAHWNLSRTVARSAMTLVKNERNTVPAGARQARRITSIVLTDTENGLTEVARPGSASLVEQPGAYFNALLRQRGVRVDAYRLSPESNAIDFDAALARVRRSDLLVVPVFVKVRTSSGTVEMPSNLQPFLKKVSELAVPAVVVLFGNPYLADALSWADAVLCAYGDTEPQVEAAAEGLFGEIDLCGKLPVTVSGRFALGAGATCSRDRLRYDDPVNAGFDPDSLRQLDRIIERAIADSAFPAAELAVLRDGMLVYSKSFGTFTYDRASRPIDNTTMFDLASVSKVIGTTSAVMKLYDNEQLGLDDRVGMYLPQFASGPKSVITIRQLITHRAGFPPFRRFFLMCSTATAGVDSIFATGLVATPGDTTIYSDIGMITMGKVVEKITGMPLHVYVRREFFEPLGMKRTMYAPPESLASQCAPTEIDTLWRKRLVQGQVHDENAALLDGVAGHAGLFSTASDLAVYMQMLLNKGAYGGVRFLKESTVIEFTRKYVPGQERYLGWDMKSPTGSSAGTLFSPSSFGHLGFTGTSVWTDPDRRISVILLTNRVHPTRASQKIQRIRPAVHDMVIRALKD
jgi:beta-glucosidase-like glycosyl hydrolase/CubicO group peptidase (beta-lactamase class C family)